MHELYTQILLLISQTMISGVFLSLNGVTIPNNSDIRFLDIGFDGILCNTDRLNCCRSADHPHRLVQGHWYFPDSNEVPNVGTQQHANPNGNFLPEIEMQEWYDYFLLAFQLKEVVFDVTYPMLVVSVKFFM